MTIRKSNVKIENGKVVLSDEVLIIIESWRTKENSEYLEKYKELLLDLSNFNSTKFDVHHIIPAFLFIDENHKNRNESEQLADKIKENKIKLSVQNHKMAHYYLWKIFPNNEKARRAVYTMFGKKDLKNMTEEEIKLNAKILEECRKENQTNEEKREYEKNWLKENESHVKEYHKNYNEKHKEERKEQKRQRYYANKEECLIKDRRPCYDPIKKDYTIYGTLKNRRLRHKDLYKDVILKDCIIQPQS